MSDGERDGVPDLPPDDTLPEEEQSIPLPHEQGDENAQPV